MSMTTPLIAGSGMIEDEFSGPIGLKELIAIALKNDPDLIELRGEITIGQANKRAQKDWRDPEIRFARSWQNDVEMEKPYEERIVERSTDRIGDSSRDQKGSKKESGTRTVTEETVRKIRPGATSDKISETTTKTEKSSGVERSVKTEDGQGERLDFNRTETLQRTTEREEYHGQDPLARDDDYSFRLRFYPPNPKDQKARLKLAQSEIDFSRAELVTKEREVISWVREMYEELQYLKASITIAREEQSAHDPFIKEMKALEGELLTSAEVGMISLKSVKSSFAVDAAQGAYDNTLGELAAQLGIVESSRIVIYESLARPSIPLESKDLGYFIQLAFANRGELKEVISEGEISQAELDVAKALYMPWFNYFQIDYGINNSGGQQTSDNYGFQFGMSLPFFSWLGHEKAIYEAAVEARYAKMGAIKRQITGQVANAYRAIKKTSALKARAESMYRSGMAKVAAVEELESVGEEGAKLRYEAAKAKIDLKEGRLKVMREYNKALLLFEAAVGSDISEIYQTSVSSAAEAFSSASESIILSEKPKPKPRKDDEKAVMELAAKIEQQATKKGEVKPIKEKESKKAEAEEPASGRKGLFGKRLFRKD